MYCNNTDINVCRYVTELLGGDTYAFCSVALPALCHLQHTMEVSEEDPAYMERFKTAFIRDLSLWQANLNTGWLKMVLALDSHFKDLPRVDREEVWTNLEVMLQKEPSRNPPEPTEKPQKKRRSLLLFA